MKREVSASPALVRCGLAILGMSDRIAVMRGGVIVDTIERARASQESILAAALEVGG
jgi:hypothetical protein